MGKGPAKYWGRFYFQMLKKKKDFQLWFPFCSGKLRRLERHLQNFSTYCIILKSSLEKLDQTEAPQTQEQKEWRKTHCWCRLFLPESLCGITVRKKMGRGRGGGGGGGGWQQAIHDKPENIMSTLIICLTGGSLNVQYSNCFFHVFSFFSLQQYEQPAKQHMTYFHCVAFSTALRALPLTLSQEPLCMTDEGSCSELTHYKLLCTWVAAFGSAAEMWSKPTVENPKACADVWLTLSHISRSSIQKPLTA